MSPQSLVIRMYTVTDMVDINLVHTVCYKSGSNGEKTKLDRYIKTER
jgi:hypothetical protein